MKLTKQNKLNLLSSVILILKGLIILLLPLFNINDPYIILSGALLVYFILKMGEYLFIRDEEYLEDLYTSLAAFTIFFIVMYIAKYNNPMYLALTLFSFIGLKSIIKVIKLDFFHDREDNMFFVNLFTFITFIVIGIITTLYLYLGNEVTTIVLGFFFVINGLLNLMEDGFRTFIN